jgi:hypothetical protein
MSFNSQAEKPPLAFIALYQPVDKAGDVPLIDQVVFCQRDRQPDFDGNNIGGERTKYITSSAQAWD